MRLAVLNYLAAGACIVGGPAVGALLLLRGRQEAAALTHAQDIKLIGRLYRDQIGLAALRDQARAAGVDRDLVEQAYFARRDGFVAIEQIAPHLCAPGCEG